MPTEYRASKPGPDQGPTPVSHKVVKTLTLNGAKKEYQSMTKTLSSITLLILASGCFTFLPAQTQTKYVCIHCKKQFPNRDTSRCVSNLPQNAWNPPGPHEYR